MKHYPVVYQSEAVCRICDGGPGNSCSCNCGYQLWDQYDHHCMAYAIYLLQQYHNGEL